MVQKYGEEEDTPLSDVVGVYGKMHPDDRKEVLDFYQEVQTGRIEFQRSTYS